MSVRRARREIGPREFLNWKAYLLCEEDFEERKRWENPTRADYQLGRVAYEVHFLQYQLSGLFGPKDMELRSYKDFILEWKFPPHPDDPPPPPPPEPRPPTPEEVEAEREKMERLSVAYRARWELRIRQAAESSGESPRSDPAG